MIFREYVYIKHPDEGGFAQKRGLTTPPKLGIGDGAIGFWNAVRKAWPQPNINAENSERIK